MSRARDLTKPTQHAALAAAIERLARDDPSAFSAMHVATIAEPLVEPPSRVHDVAYAIAQRLVRNLEDEFFTVATLPRSGRGRVTDPRLDQRLRANRTGR